MNENSNEKNHQIEILHLDKQIKKVQLYTALVVFLGTVATTAATWWTVDKSEKQSNQQIEQIIKDAVGPRKEKPLEGIWNYNSEYQKWHKEKNPEELKGKGKAIIIWKDKEKRYDVFISYKITRISDKIEKSLLALSLKGIIDNVDSYSGQLKQQKFSMDDFEIIARVHYDNLGPPTLSYQFTDCNYQYNTNENQINSIKCDLITKYSESSQQTRSESKVTFTRKTSLH